MILVSHYLLDIRDCHALQITDTYSLHRVAYSLFEDVRDKADKVSVASGILYADKGVFKGMRRLVIISDRQPVTPEYGRLETRELPSAFLEFLRYRYDCIVNPVRHSGGKHTPIRGRAAVTDWFIEKAEKWGFRPDPETLQVADITVDCFQKKDRAVTLSKARITGSLTVTDRERFIRSVSSGIGRGKAFGCGLLQVAPLVF